jgi:RTX calcium-binding nonapeptide repeat (4 copies)
VEPGALAACVATLLASVITFTLVVAPAAPASVRCEHSETPVHKLEVVSYEDPQLDLDLATAVVRREDNRIVVLKSRELGERGAALQVECAGTPATVFNTDTVVFQQFGLNVSTLDFAGGPFAPGTTVEADGNNEIETVFRAKRESVAAGVLAGTNATEEWRFGGDRRQVTAFLDRFRPEEADVTFTGPGVSVAAAAPGDGDDRVDATEIRARGFTFLVGGRGDDVLLGSKFRDVLEGGTGRDLLDAGPGDDDLDSRDRFRDRVRCGPGNDRAAPGKSDRVSACERILPLTR